MKFKTMLMMVVAIGCGLVAMLGVQQALSGKQTDRPVDDGKTQVLVTTVEVLPGSPLDDTNVKFTEWPKDLVPAGAVTTKEEYAERALTVHALPGEVVMNSRLGEPGIYGASSDIPEGMRVVTVSVDLTMTHSGLIAPGDRVDILVTYTIRNPQLGEVMKTKTVLENIQVFATDNIRNNQEVEQQEIKAKNISFLVTPEQSQLLMLAEQKSKGRLHLALRSKGDNTLANSNAIDDSLFNDLAAISFSNPTTTETKLPVKQFLDKQETKAEPEPKAEKPVEVVPTWKIEIYSGGNKQIQELPLPQDELAEVTAVTTDGGTSASWVHFVKSMWKQSVNKD